MNIINPYQNTEKTYRAIVVGERIARWMATLITSVGFFAWARDLAIKYIPEGWPYSHQMGIAAGLLAAMAAAYLTDMMFGELLQKVSFDIIAAKHPNVTKWQGPQFFKKLRQVEKYMFLVLLLGLLSFDLYTSLIIRDPIADSARAEQTIDPDALRAEIAAQNAAEIAALDKAAKEKRSNIAQAEAGAKNSNKSLSKLAQEGNTWAQNQINAKAAKATKSEKAQLNTIEETRAAKIAAAATYTEQRLQQVMAANQDAESKTRQNREIMASMYTIFTVVPKLLAMLLRVLMVVSFLAYSQQFNPDISGDGIIDYNDVEMWLQNRQASRSTGATVGGFSAAPPPTGAGPAGAAFP